MRDKISETTRKIFESAWKRIQPFQEMILTRPAIIAYSGGKDSSILLHFYFWLWIEKKIPAPCVYHLDHSIRFNLDQEKKILDYAENTFPFPRVFKKKTFRFYPASWERRSKKPEERSVIRIWKKFRIDTTVTSLQDIILAII